MKVFLLDTMTNTGQKAWHLARRQLVVTLFGRLCIWSWNCRICQNAFFWTDSGTENNFHEFRRFSKYWGTGYLHWKTDHKNRSKCYICNKASKVRINIKEHVEIMHIFGLSFDCSFCGKTFSSRNALRVHKSRVCNKKELK